MPEQFVIRNVALIIVGIKTGNMFSVKIDKDIDFGQ